MTAVPPLEPHRAARWERPDAPEALRERVAAVLRPGDGVGAPVATAHPDHQPIVPLAGGEPPYCTCGVVGGRGIDVDGRPLLADHLREVDPTYGRLR